MELNELKKQLLAEIRQAEKPMIVSIDGRCASGKSTFGRWLADELGADLIHMDDFYLRPEQRTPERYQTPGGNVDAERFTAEVLLPLKEGKPFDYHPFDCINMKVSEQSLHILAKEVTVIEGSYSQRDDLAPYNDLKIFLDVSPEKQMERIRERNPDKAEQFRERWIPLEELYFRECRVKEKADIVIDTTEAF